MQLVRAIAHWKILPVLWARQIRESLPKSHHIIPQLSLRLFLTLYGSCRRVILKQRRTKLTIGSEKSSVWQKHIGFWRTTGRDHFESKTWSRLEFWTLVSILSIPHLNHLLKQDRSSLIFAWIL